MIPSILAYQIKEGIQDFLKTTFPVSTPLFHGIFERLFEKHEELFKGPYLTIRLPFRSGIIDTDFFPVIPTQHTPYLHQEIAFKRLKQDNTQSTIIATGTGSGKTECFMYPILDYCYRQRDENGVKAIIIYPMNALAIDQAKRFAKTIYNNQTLRNRITAGLYIGQNEKKASLTMTPDMIITDRDTLRLKPPDILLTNYKMLDYLLIRPNDYKLWKFNKPDTLKYLVVDELHSFDGAQATDLACLIRRLKSRLRCPENYLCCVGTSATLGGKTNTEDLIKFASDVFGEDFNGDSIITESLISVEEFFKEYFIKRFEPVSKEYADKLDPDLYKDFKKYIDAQHELWFGEHIDDINSDIWKIELAHTLKEHAFFRNLLLILNNKTLTIDDIKYSFEKIDKEFLKASDHYKTNVISSLLALISCARIKANDSLLPFLHVRVQFWLRELRRIVADIKQEPAIKFYDDLKEDQLHNHLPLIHCRECGAMGWTGTKREQDDVVNPDLLHFYTTFFNYGPTVVFIFPYEEDYIPSGQQEFKEYLCGHCLRIFHMDSDIESCPSCGNSDRIVRITIPNTRIKQKDRIIGSHNCPFCDSYNSMTIVGSRAASLLSIAIGQLFASNYNDDKKLLAFSDSVQDASHRSGFFSARTYRFNFRTAIQQFLLKDTIERKLSDIHTDFIDYWSKEMPQNKFITTFIPPDMTWLKDYEELILNYKLPRDSDLLEDVKKRIQWEIVSEYGFNSRIGRTLEKTGSSVAYFNPDIINKAIVRMVELLKNKIGGLRSISISDITRFVYGFLTHLKSRGAIYQDSLNNYIQDFGGYYRINQIPYMPNYGKFSRTPIFLTTKGGTRFDRLLGGGATRYTWSEDWVDRNLKHLYTSIAEFSANVYFIVINALKDERIIIEHEVRNHKAWSINPESLLVGLNVKQYRCNVCSHNVSVIDNESSFWDDNSCLRFKCTGRYKPEELGEDYYRRLYSSGDIERIFSQEHTGLLERDVRERIEERFINGTNPGDPNLLSCTPTLELGIDIGDLSTILLCSVPPSQSNYLQRIGRAGREEGNSIDITVANGRAHDLYFYNEPLEMISGEVNPPGCFLNASAILERQYIGFCFDKWIEKYEGKINLPNKLVKVLNNVKSGKSSNVFPYDFLNFIDNERQALFYSFIGIFKNQISDNSISQLKYFVYGNGTEFEDASYRIINGLSELLKERENLRNRVQRLNNVIKQKEQNPAKDKNYEFELNELKREKYAFYNIIKSINDKDTFNFGALDFLMGTPKILW